MFQSALRFILDFSIVQEFNWKSATKKSTKVDVVIADELKICYSFDCQVPIKKPLILIQDRQLKKDAIDIFKLILGYMGDRTIKGKSPEKLALELTTKGWNTPVLRDEIYLQLCKQTTDNFRP